MKRRTLRKRYRRNTDDPNALIATVEAEGVATLPTFPPTSLYDRFKNTVYLYFCSWVECM